MSRLRTRRYQLSKRGLSILESGHPWIFRGHVSSATSVFEDGQWLHLVDGENRVVGFGTFEREGAIAIRLLHRGPELPRGDWVRTKLVEALARREALRENTDAFRALHGEGDGIPAVTADVYGPVAVVASYSSGMDAVGRLAAGVLHRSLGLDGALFRYGGRRQDRATGARVLRGEVPDLVRVREDDVQMTVPVRWGQKTGAFLDLRGLRRLVRRLPLEGARVLDLFSYTGTLAAAAETARAAEIWHVDASGAALDLAAQHHVAEPGRHRFIRTDVFDWVDGLDAPPFELVIADPPQMTSRASQVPQALKAYGRLYRALAGCVAPRGTLVACCCTSRIHPESFREIVGRSLGVRFRFVERLPPELDHPVAFPEGDYLKILVFRRRRK